LPGTPDVILPKRKLAIFVHGCFWHSHGCSAGKLPKSRLDYWLPKLSRNITRHQLAERALHDLGWRTAVIWECETKTPHDLRAALERLLSDEIKMPLP
jgi:DNA mismatch endonuclease (patch repair protein)